MRAIERSDLFALGVLLHEMLAGKPPFTGETDAALGAAIVSDEPPPIAGAPPAVQRLVQRCLAKEFRPTGGRLHMIWPRPGLALRGGARRSGSNRPHALRRLAAVAGVVAIAAFAWWAFSARTARTPPLPVVVLMDSTLSERVYDPETRALGGTNSDDVTDALRNLPVILLKEPTSALWHREEQLLREHPSLVMMHLSSFARPTPNHESDRQPEAIERTRAFLAFVGVGIRRRGFVVYTRGYETEQERKAWVSETEERFPVLKGRVQMLHVPGGDEKATFRDPSVKQRVRELVIATLALPEKP